ncbi:MAG: triose-phosphate isomerase [Spirochaetes bacterium]|nr:triose-phosphate isomerase [Spirochaetota bacterium]
MVEYTVFANWKMNKRIEEAVEFIEELTSFLLPIDKNLAVIMCIPYPYIDALVRKAEGGNVLIGAENVFYEECGEYTGEVSASMLASIGCSHVLIGHSERRKYFHENDSDVNKKALSVLRNRMTPIICIGETMEEREEGRVCTVLERQIRTCLAGIPKNRKLFIAYEPRWAIGTGKTPEMDEIENAHCYIREKIIEFYGETVSKNIALLYGGSVKPDNTFDICLLKDVDGVGVGGCSLDIDCFTKVIKEMIRASSRKYHPANEIAIN